MRLSMEIKLIVNVNEGYSSAGAGITVPNVFIEAFEPIKTCDDPTIAYCTGDSLSESSVVIRSVKIREDAAESLAKALTKEILSAMSRQDTHNGYSVQKAATIGKYSGTV